MNVAAVEDEDGQTDGRPRGVARANAGMTSLGTDPAASPPPTFSGHTPQLVRHQLYLLQLSQSFDFCPANFDLRSNELLLSNLRNRLLPLRQLPSMRRKANLTDRSRHHALRRKEMTEPKRRLHHERRAAKHLPRPDLRHPPHQPRLGDRPRRAIRPIGDRPHRTANFAQVSIINPTIFRGARDDARSNRVVEDILAATREILAVLDQRRSETSRPDATTVFVILLVDSIKSNLKSAVQPESAGR